MAGSDPRHFGRLGTRWAAARCPAAAIAQETVLRAVAPVLAVLVGRRLARRLLGRCGTRSLRGTVEGQHRQHEGRAHQQLADADQCTTSRRTLSHIARLAFEEFIQPFHLEVSLSVGIRPCLADRDKPGPMPRPAPWQ
ncbi:hypothetical protein SDC9_209517 [bioreactor metagenome]|uniref:Uncharacterized protein n=1 Tax=bioreactor metagenome TaxID=1076179 RepID=A0A645JDH9_9ZZZZ